MLNICPLAGDRKTLQLSRNQVTTQSPTRTEGHVLQKCRAEKYLYLKRHSKLRRDVCWIFSKEIGPGKQILALKRKAERSSLAEEAAQGHCSTRGGNDREELGAGRVPWPQIDNLVKSTYAMAQAEENTP